MTNRVGRSAVSVEFVGHVINSFQDVVSQSIQLFRRIGKAPARRSCHRSAYCVRANEWRNQNVMMQR